MREDQPITATIDGEDLWDDPGFTLPERWKVTRILGAGGQGQVWLAFDSELQEQVAVKVLGRPDRVSAVERLRREVRVGRRLRHRHVIQVYELLDAGETLAVVMEYLEGGTLADKIAGGPLAIDEVLRIGRALLEGLACLHDQGIVHRDVKPSNVLFDGAGILKLADFGTLRPIGDALGVTATELTVGTPAYMSPEQVQGRDPAPPSDLYSLGVTLYRLVAGCRPFEGGSEFDVARRHMTDAPRPLRWRRKDCPRWLAAFVHRLMSKKPEHRWPDARAALKAFETNRWRPTRRTMVRSAAGLAAAVVIGAAGIAGFDRWSELDPVVENGDLVIRNGLGRTRWRTSMPGQIPVAAVADVSPEPGTEVVTGVIREAPGRRRPEIVLFSRRGREISRTPFTAAGMLYEKYFPGMTEDLQVHRMTSVDLGGILGRGVVWIGGDRSWYPGFLGITARPQGFGCRPVFVNSGHLRAFVPMDIDGDGQQELLVAGINNEMGFQAFGAVVDTTSNAAVSPNLLTMEEAGLGLRGLKTYVPLGETQEDPIGIVDRRRRGGPLEILTGHRAIDVSADGTIAGITAEEARTFWTAVVGVESRLRSGETHWRGGIDELAAGWPAIWERIEFRGAASLMLSKHLAAGGRPGEAAALLEWARESGIGLRRLHRRLGEMYLLAGNRAEGRAALQAAVATVGRGFGPIDECIALAIDDALSQDEEAWTRTVNTMKSIHFTSFRRQFEVVFNFFGGRFSACSIDLTEAPGRHLQAFVLRNWAAIERGGGARERLDDLRRLQLRAECGPLATMALARWEVLNGHPGDAVRKSANALWNLEERSAASWVDAAYLPLARWAYATVLDLEGQDHESRRLLESVAAAAPSTFFGRDAQERLSR